MRTGKCTNGDVVVYVTSHASETLARWESEGVFVVSVTHSRQFS